MKKEMKGITLIALVVTIVVLLILAGVSIVMLTGENGVIKQATDTRIKQAHANVKDVIMLEYNEQQMELKMPNTTTIADYIEFLKDKEILKTDGIVDTEKLLGSKLYLGNGSGNKEVYKVEKEENEYILKYYDNTGTPTILWEVVSIETSNVKLISFTLNDETYYAEDGMTWADWIGSEYDTFEESILHIREFDGMVGGNGPLWRESIEKDIPGTEKIDENERYVCKPIAET